MSSLPPMTGMEMPGLSLEEMPSMPLSSTNMSIPDYTVTSPPPGEMKHSVQTTEDYKDTAASDVNDSVLLKFKEGSDYKLALNMQQFSPDDITSSFSSDGVLVIRAPKKN